MKITNLKMNGITNPIGFAYDKLLCSCTVEETGAKKLRNAKIEVSLEEDFTTILYCMEGADICLSEQRLDMECKPRTTYYYRVSVTGDNGDTAVSGTAAFETGKMTEPWCAEWIGMEEADAFHPVFTTGFQAAKPVRRARLYVCGLGVYEAFLNGSRVGSDYLAPFLNDYTTELQYQTYPVTDMLREENTLSISLGNGWYKGRFGLDQHDNNFGDRFSLIAELWLEYDDGSCEVVRTDGKWTYRGSDVQESSIYDGEVYNRLLWEADGCPEERPGVEGNPSRPAAVLAMGKQKLVERFSIPLVIKEDITPKELIRTPAGELVLDMGQNFTGYMEFTAKLPRGTRVVLDFGEVLQNGNFYNANYRTAISQFVYVSNGEEEQVHPHFTFFGFRYVRVSGWAGELRKEDFTGRVVYSDLSRTGYLITSNDKINRLYENCIWGQKSNFLDVPTDCPQRDERLGWTGDSQVFSMTASYNMDTRAFYRKHLRDLRDEQQKMDGAVPFFVPSFGSMGNSCSVWGDVATIIPDTLYRAFGNLEEMYAYYPLMKDWVDHITGIDEKNGTHHLYDTGFHFGDWLALDGVTSQSVKGGTDDYYIASVYYCHSAELVSVMAARLGKTEDAAHYKELSEAVKAAIFREYFTPAGRLAVDTQAAYIIALKFGIYMDKDKLLAQFKNRLQRDCYKIKCGFVGAPLLCLVLCENGMEELAYDFLFQEDFPSWLYCVNLGATTIWERWNSLLPDGSISGTGMNSLNHYSYGSVIEFLYAYAAGIRPVGGGYKKAILAPVPNMRLRFLKCRYDSVNGIYRSDWEITESGRIKIHMEIPFDCTAKVSLPRYPKAENPLGLSLQEDGCLTLDSGSYDFDYVPEEDYRKIYNHNTRLVQLSTDEEAMQILRDILPEAAETAGSEDIESANRPLSSLLSGGFGSFGMDKAGQAVNKILDLERW